MSHIHAIVPILQHIVNLCLTTGDFPISCKSSIVIPLIKKPGLDREMLKKLTFFSCRYITLLSSTASHISAQCHCITAGHQLYTLVAGVGSLASVPLSVVPLYNRMWCHHHSTPICSYCICIFQLSFSVC